MKFDVPSIGSTTHVHSLPCQAVSASSLTTSWSGNARGEAVADGVVHLEVDVGHRRPVPLGPRRDLAGPIEQPGAQVVAEGADGLGRGRATSSTSGGGGGEVDMAADRSPIADCARAVRAGPAHRSGVGSCGMAGAMRGDRTCLRRTS